MSPFVPEEPLTPGEVKDLPVRSTELEDDRVGVGQGLVLIAPKP